MNTVSATELTDALSLASSWQKGDGVVVPTFRQLVLVKGGVEVYSEAGIISSPVTGIDVEEPVCIERLALASWHGQRRGSQELTLEITDGHAVLCSGAHSRISIPVHPMEGVSAANWEVDLEVTLPDSAASSFTDDIRSVGFFSGDPTVSGEHAGVHVYPGDSARMYATDNLGAASCSSVPYPGRPFVVPHALAARSSFLSADIPVTAVQYGVGGQVTLVRADGAKCSFQSAKPYDLGWWDSVLPGYSEGAPLPDGFLQTISSFKRLATAAGQSTGVIDFTVRDGVLTVSMPECPIATPEATFDTALRDVHVSLVLSTFARALTHTTHYNVTEEGLVSRKGRVTNYCSPQ